jgi:hypothetical protein
MLKAEPLEDGGVAGVLSDGPDLLWESRGPMEWPTQTFPRPIHSIHFLLEDVTGGWEGQREDGEGVVQGGTVGRVV